MDKMERLNQHLPEGKPELAFSALRSFVQLGVASVTNFAELHELVIDDLILPAFANELQRSTGELTEEREVGVATLELLGRVLKDLEAKYENASVLPEPTEVSSAFTQRYKRVGKWLILVQHSKEHEVARQVLNDMLETIEINEPSRRGQTSKQIRQKQKLARLKDKKTSKKHK